MRNIYKNKVGIVLKKYYFNIIIIIFFLNKLTTHFF